MLRHPVNIRGLDDSRRVRRMRARSVPRPDVRTLKRPAFAGGLSA
ncbi:MAG TPA: hypothetical protein VK013_10405 [Myxococcaceae bacterium]|nr:hypothetical protein [Myxococcaceae bacterium]